MKDLEAMASQAMTPEMEAALAELVQIPEIKKMLGEQGRQLAELFTSKIGGDDLAKVTDDLAKADERLEQQSLPRPCGRLNLARCAPPSE